MSRPGKSERTRYPWTQWVDRIKDAWAQAKTEYRSETQQQIQQRGQGKHFPPPRATHHRTKLHKKKKKVREFDNSTAARSRILEDSVLDDPDVGQTILDEIAPGNSSPALTEAIAAPEMQTKKRKRVEALDDEDFRREKIAALEDRLEEMSAQLKDAYALLSQYQLLHPQLLESEDQLQRDPEAGDLSGTSA